MLRLGLALACALTLALIDDLPSIGTLGEAMPRQVSAMRMQQPATSTATLQITLPSATPGRGTRQAPTSAPPGASATPTFIRSAATPRIGPLPSASPEADREREPEDATKPARDSNSDSGADESESSGEAAGGELDPSSEAEREDSPPNREGSEPAMGAAAAAGQSGLDRGAALRDQQGGPAPPAPRGLIGPAPEDPGLRELWLAQGSPRQGQGILARLSDGRPGPAWLWPVLILLLAAGLGWSALRTWRAIGPE